LPAASAYRLAIDGEFHDSKTLAALLLAQPLIKNRDNNINTKLNDF
jgi:hypothetical protein